MDWKNHLEKNPIEKIEKTQNQSEIGSCERKPLARKLSSVQIPFSHSTLKLEQKITPWNHLLFRSSSCFGVTKITTPIWLQKSWKCVNRSLKKRQRPYTIQILSIVKNQEKANNSLSYRFAAIKNKSWFWKRFLFIFSLKSVTASFHLIIAVITVKQLLLGVHLLNQLQLVASSLNFDEVSIYISKNKKMIEPSVIK